MPAYVIFYCFAQFIDRHQSVSKPGLNFRRRSEDSGDDKGHVHADECESSNLGDFLSQAHTLVSCFVGFIFRPLNLFRQTSDDLESLREQLREFILED